MPTTINFLPPGPQELRYDEHAFERRTNCIDVHHNAPERARIVEEPEAEAFKTTGLGFIDLMRISTVHRRGNACRPIPDWSRRDSDCQEVVCRCLEARLYLDYGTGMPWADRLARIQTVINRRLPLSHQLLDSLLERQGKVRDQEIQMVDTLIVTCKRGLPALICAVLYMRYRLFWTSTAISAEIGIKPPAVRILLYRMNIIYKKWQAGLPRRSFAFSEQTEAGKERSDILRNARTYRNYRKHKEFCEEAYKHGRLPQGMPKFIPEISALRAKGIKWQAISEKFGYTLMSMRSVFYRWADPKDRAWHPVRPQCPPDWLAEVNKRHAQGQSFEEIGLSMGRNMYTVRGYYYKWRPGKKARNTTQKKQGDLR